MEANSIDWEIDGVRKMKQVITDNNLGTTWVYKSLACDTSNHFMCQKWFWKNIYVLSVLERFHILVDRQRVRGTQRERERERERAWKAPAFPVQRVTIVPLTLFISFNGIIVFIEFNLFGCQLDWSVS